MAKAKSEIVGAQIVLVRKDGSTEEYTVSEPFGEFRWKKDFILDEATGLGRTSRRTEFSIIGGWDDPNENALDSVPHNYEI